jgi:uncharacterized membrane protein
MTAHASVDTPPAERDPATGSAARTPPAPNRRSDPRSGSTWRVPAALVALSLIPLVAGALRLVEVAGGPQLIPANPRIDAVPAPVVVHIAAATVFAVLGALQFSAGLRRRHATWHRRSGRVLVGAGLLVAVSGLWMTLFYTGAPGGALLWGIRLLVGVAMATSIVLGFAAIRRRNITAHRAWMIRAYALAVGAGTQTLTQGVGEGLFGTGDLSTAVSLGSAWVINAAVAEWVIRRPAARRAGRARARTAVAGSR